MAQSTIRKDLRRVTRELSEDERKQLLKFAKRLSKGEARGKTPESLSEHDGRPSYLALSNLGEYEFQKKHEDNPSL